MKKIIILSLFIITFALTISAGSVRMLMAQSGSEIAPTPAETKTEPTAPAPAEPVQAAPAETKTEAPAPTAPALTATTPPAPTPAAPVETKTTSAAPNGSGWVATAPTSTALSETTKKSFMVRLSHKEFAKMSLKECADCHKGSGVAPTHGSDQMREHVSIARRSGKNCVDCHSQQFCLDCHKGGGIDADLRTDNYRRDYVPNTHRTDFREIHPLKALDNPQSCYRCHDARFCSTCHAKFKGEELMVQSHRRSWSDKQAGTAGPAHSTFSAGQCQTCHPGGLLPKHEWSADHAREARRNLQACQTCHSDGDICMTCHSARSGLMVNPHPRNWSSISSKYRSRSDGKTCVKCHDRF